MKIKTTKSKPHSAFSRNLKRLLEERAISQRKAAELAEVSTSTFNDWLAGAAPSDFEAIQRLCRALNADFEFLLTGQKGRADFANIPLAEVFDIQDEPDFSGFFEITARRLRKKGGDEK